MKSAVKTGIIAVRIEPEIKERAEAIAAIERRSISSWVGALIADKVAATPTPTRPRKRVREPVTSGSR